MWRVEEISLRKSRLDFSSSGQDSRDVTQIIADGTVLANATELTQWKERGFQVIVCEECGCDGCEPGGWVAPRWTGANVILLPDFTAMAEGEWGRNEHRPPDYFGSRGMPILRESIAEAVPAFSRPHELPMMTGKELVHAVQWTAPMSILGRFPEPARVRRRDVIATSAEDLPSALDGLEAEIQRLEASTEGIVLRAGTGEDQPVSFYLDDPGSTEWAPFVETGGRARLSLGRDLIVA